MLIRKCQPIVARGQLYLVLQHTMHAEKTLAREEEKKRRGKKEERKKKKVEPQRGWVEEEPTVCRPIM